MARNKGSAARVSRCYGRLLCVYLMVVCVMATSPYENELSTEELRTQKEADVPIDEQLPIDRNLLIGCQTPWPMQVQNTPITLCKVCKQDSVFWPVPIFVRGPESFWICNIRPVLEHCNHKTSALGPKLSDYLCSRVDDVKKNMRFSNHLFMSYTDPKEIFTTSPEMKEVFDEKTSSVKQEQQRMWNEFAEDDDRPKTPSTTYSGMVQYRQLFDGDNSTAIKKLTGVTNVRTFPEFTYAADKTKQALVIQYKEEVKSCAFPVGAAVTCYYSSRSTCAIGHYELNVLDDPPGRFKQLWVQAHTPEEEDMLSPAKAAALEETERDSDLTVDINTKTRLRKGMKKGTPGQLRRLLSLTGRRKKRRKKTRKLKGTSKQKTGGKHNNYGTRQRKRKTDRRRKARLKKLKDFKNKVRTKVKAVKNKVGKRIRAVKTNIHEGVAARLAALDKETECYLTYCNEHQDLVKAFCGSETCASKQQASKCKRHWAKNGSKEQRRNDPTKCASMGCAKSASRGYCLADKACAYTTNRGCMKKAKDELDELEKLNSLTKKNPKMSRSTAKHHLRASEAAARRKKQMQSKDLDPVTKSRLTRQTSVTNKISVILNIQDQAAVIRDRVMALGGSLIARRVALKNMKEYQQAHSAIKELAEEYKGWKATDVDCVQAGVLYFLKRTEKILSEEVIIGDIPPSMIEVEEAPASKDQECTQADALFLLDIQYPGSYLRSSTGCAGYESVIVSSM